MIQKCHLRTSKTKKCVKYWTRIRMWPVEHWQKNYRIRRRILRKFTELTYATEDFRDNIFSTILTVLLNFCSKIYIDLTFCYCFLFLKHLHFKTLLESTCHFISCQNRSLKCLSNAYYMFWRFWSCSRSLFSINLWIIFLK